MALGLWSIPSGYLTVCHGIDGLFIDGLPVLIAWWIFPWRTVSHNQMVHDNVNDNPLELGEKHHFMEVI